MKYLRLGIISLFRVRVDERAALLPILLLAFALRVYRLGAQAIWWDESLSVYRATRDLATILANTILIQNVVTHDTVPPLYFVFLHFFVRVFGTSEFAFRFFSLAANVATIPLLYALARRWFSRQVALIAALLGSLSPFYVWYAQEARPYALVLFASLLAVYALTRAFGPVIASEAKNLPHNGTRRRWILAYLLAAIAALYTHYYSIFLIPFHAILIAMHVWPLRVPRLRAFILLPALPLASTIFLIPLIKSSAAGNVDTGPYFVPLFIILRDLLNSFSVGVTVDFAQVVWIDAALLAIFLVGVAVSRSWRAVIFLLAYIAIPVLGVQAASYFRPLYQNSRYLIALSPAFYLGVAAGIAALARRWKNLALPALGIFLVGAMLSLNNLYFDPRFGKDDHRAWAEYLRERVRPGDFLILDSPHTEELYQYYARARLPWASLPILRGDGVDSPDADLAAVRDAYRRYPRVWFLEMHVPFDDPTARIEKLLNQEGALLNQVNFTGTSTEISLSLFVPSLPLGAASDIAHPLNAAFDSRLRLLGYDVPASIESGGRGIVMLYWQLDERVGEDFGVSLRVVDDAGTRWGQWDAVPLGNRAGSSTWAPQKIIADAHDLPITVGTRPGRYRLQVQVYHTATGAVLGDAVMLGDIAVVRPRMPIDPATIRVSHQADQTVGVLRVIGGDWSEDARPGDTIPIALYLQVVQTPTADVPILLRLVQRAIPFVGPLTTRGATSLIIPVRDLEIGDILRQNISLQVLPDASGECELQAMFPSRTINLGSVRVQSIAHTWDVPKMQHPQVARIGEIIEWLGYDVNTTRMRGGDTLRLTLYWRARSRMGTSLKVFTHVIDGNNQIVGQQDSIPVAGTRPTTGWVPGEVITDAYSIILKDTLPPGKYAIEIGFYDAVSGARLPTFDANGAALGDRILLPDVEVQ